MAWSVLEHTRNNNRILPAYTNADKGFLLFSEQKGHRSILLFDLKNMYDV